MQGMVAVACIEAAGFSERVERMGQAQVQPSAVLVWSMRDPLRPYAVLHSPGEVFALQANPATPSILAGGTFDGQVVLWDMAQTLVSPLRPLMPAVWLHLCLLRAGRHIGCLKL